MKKLTLLFLCSIIFLNGFSQDPPKGANVVKVESDSLADIDLFRAGVEMLKALGYSFDRIYTDFLVCSTKPLKPNKIEMEYWIDLSVRDNVLHVRSYVKNVGTISGNSGMLSSTSGNAWERGANRSLATRLWRYGWDKQVHIANRIALFYSGKLSYYEDVE